MSTLTLFLHLLLDLYIGCLVNIFDFEAVRRILLSSVHNMRVCHCILRLSNFVCVVFLYYGMSAESQKRQPLLGNGSVILPIAKLWLCVHHVKATTDTHATI
jgi:hypothetical protein